MMFAEMSQNRPRSIAALAAAALFLCAGGAQAEISGRIELTYQTFTTPTDSSAAPFAGAGYGGPEGNIRLMWQERWSNVSAELHYKLSATGGDTALVRRATGMGPTGANTESYLDLTRVLKDGDTLIATHTIDRLSLTYTTPSVVVRLGRQALTWGTGRVFHPMDLVAPFSPDATDTEYKPGVDMAYLQWLFQDGSDLELIGVPRRSVAGGPATRDASTLAMRYRTSLGALGASFVLAQDHGDTTAGVGLSGSLGGAAWNAEIVPTRRADGTMATSGLANITGAGTIAGRNAIYFAEYFHNGFGVAGTPASLAALPADLTDRMARGQVFTIGQDYLALGLTLEMSPLIGFGSNLIVNAGDESYLASASLNWSLSDNANLILGAQLPGGGRGSEFGGLSVSGGGAPYAVPEKSVYLQYRQYF